jgi:predicted Zn-ribbon and HTH transcriptional regulator
MPRTHLAGMYRSRFRCNKKSATPTQRGSKTTIYTNRSNRHVIDRMLDLGKKRHEQLLQTEYATDLTEIERLDNQLVELEMNNRHEITFFTMRRMLEKKHAMLKQRTKVFESGDYLTHWNTKTQQLYKRKDHHVGRLVISNRIMGRPTESFYTDPDKCNKCGVFYTFDNVTNVHTCTQCGFTVDVLFISEDNSQDVLVTKDPNTGSSVATKPQSDYHYIRSPLYKRYLSQFSENVPVIPTEVMRVLYRYLSNIHLQNSIRCRPTPVGNILRTHGFSKWANLAIRITKLFNGDPIPVIPSEVIERLVLRFDVIFRESSRQKQKLPSFEFITNILLRIEGRPDLASSFALHKTRIVLRRIANDLYKLIEHTKEESSDLTWDNVPVF